MSPRRRPPAPVHYELRIDGHLDEHWSAWFGGMTLVLQEDGTTTLRGPVTDQAELHGLLAKIRDLGAPLLSLNPGEAPDRSGALPHISDGDVVVPVRRTQWERGADD